jgi:hypothetical protein
MNDQFRLLIPSTNEKAEVRLSNLLEMKTIRAQRKYTTKENNIGNKHLTKIELRELFWATFFFSSQW